MIWKNNVHLMVDVNLVECEESTSMVREEVFKPHAEPLIGPRDTPLLLGQTSEDGSSSAVPVMVIKDGSRYRMWYQIRGVSAYDTAADQNKRAPVAYAESDDGVHFKPVEIGREEWNGSRQNNLVHFEMPPDVPIRLSGFMHDPLDSEWPFKCVYNRPASSSEMEPGLLARYPNYANREWYFVWGIGRSRDGLSWEMPRHDHNMVHAHPEHAHLHRAFDGGLVLSDQMMSSMADWGYRNVKGWITYDEETAHRIPDYLFSMPQHMARLHSEYFGDQWNGQVWVQPHMGLVCARYGSTMMALHGYLYGATGVETFAQMSDVGLSASSTGITFRDVWPFRPFIQRGLRGSWDDGMVAQVAIVENDDETLFYYTGGKGNLGAHYWPGVASIPRDRYGYRCIKGYRNTSLRDAIGRFTLKICELPQQPQFAVNVSQANSQRTVKLELLDENDHVLPGYSAADCEPVVENGLRVIVQWKKNHNGAELGGRKVKILVVIESKDCCSVMDDSPRVYAVYTGAE
ncbi:MAG: hypothetical protein ABI210_01405 [Abditibacteriaceae bacterium]